MSDQDPKQQPTPEQLEWAKRFLARLESARKKGLLKPPQREARQSGFRARSERTPRDIRFVN